jgi:NAD(P)-dependent dehydrogenase (short-subunit alcohol dehydrogenase family)
MAGILQGKRALVTGGHRGIGRAIVEAFVSAGAHTAIADIEGADKAALEIGAGTVGMECDVRSADSVAAAVAEAVRELGGLDLLVNNAGVESLAPLHEMAEEEFDRLVSVNLRGTWLVYKHAVPALVDGGGAIVNIASQGRQPRPDHPVAQLVAQDSLSVDGHQTVDGCTPASRSLSKA